MKILYSITFLLLLIGCKGNTETEIKTAPSHQNDGDKKISQIKDINRTLSVSEVAFNDPSLDSIYKAYLKVKASLVNTNSIEGQKNAIALSQVINNVDYVSKVTKEAVDAIVSKDNIEEQRIAFDVVSDNLEILLTNSLASGTIYKQYCPMAFNGKGGNWLSDSKEIRNPYFGDKMLTCGVVNSNIE